MLVFRAAHPHPARVHVVHVATIEAYLTSFIRSAACTHVCLLRDNILICQVPSASVCFITSSVFTTQNVALLPAQTAAVM